MIQRIQTIYLILTTILAGLFLTGNISGFINKEGPEYIMNIRGIYEVSVDNNQLLIDKTIIFLLVSSGIPAISLITIFLFKNRKMQLKFTLSLVILDLFVIAAIIYYGILYVSRYTGTIIPEFRIFIPLINLILLILAYRGIRKDENLVRSYDRLR